MKIYDHNPSINNGEEKQPPIKKTRRNIVIIALSVLCALLLFTIIILGVIIAFLNTKHIVKPSFSTQELSEKVISQVVKVKSQMEGSGVIISVDGEKYIITNYHLIKNADSAKVMLYGEFDYLDASVLGFDVYHDIALLKCDFTNNITVAQIDEFTSIKVGQYALAVGNNLGRGIAVFDGIISQTSQMLSQSDNGENKTVPVYQVTTPINTGMSGGALYDNMGRLIGINTYTNVNVCGVNYSVPVSIALPIARKIVIQNKQSGNTTQIQKIYMQNTHDNFFEINFGDLNFRAEYCVNGLRVTLGGENLVTMTGAIKVGDIITQLGNLQITSKTQIVPLYAEVLNYALSPDSSAPKLSVKLIRDAQTLTIFYYNLARQ